jgi:PAS domain S-box-containing protein
MSGLLPSQSSNKNPTLSASSTGKVAPSSSEGTVLLDTLIDLAPDAILIADCNGILTEVNAHACRLLSYSREELLGKAIATLIPKNSPEISTCLDKYGDLIPVEAHTKTLPDGRWVAFIRDLRDRLVENDRNQQNLEHSQKADHLLELEAIYNTTPIGLAILDRELRFVRLNQRLAEINGISIEDHIDRPVGEILPDLADEVEPLFRRVLETGEPLLNLEISGETAAQPGVKRTWLESWFPLRDARGQIIGVNAVIQEITERKQAEAALQEHTNHIQVLYETTRDLLSTNHPLDLVDTVFAKLKSLVGLDVYFNYLIDEERQQLHLEFYGGISDELARSIEWLEVGRAVCGMVAEQRCQVVQPHLQQSTDPKTELVRSLGLTAYSCQPLIAQGKLFGTLGFGSRSRTSFTRAETDLFQAICDQIAIALERSELFTSLQHQTEELRRTNRLKDEFFSSLSHELRTPLNPILGWTKMLQGQKLSPEKVTQALGTIERNARLQIRLVDDLLDVARVIQGKLRLDSHPVDLVATLSTAIETVEFAAQAKSINLNFTYPEAVYTNGDGDRLGQVFWNLLSNAIKFTPEGGTVDVELFVAQSGLNRYAQIRVSDTGIGISHDFLPHIFEYFRQAEGGSARKYSGLGLGLAIVRHLVELHGGTVTAESKGDGQGATFIVKLPLLDRDNTPVYSDLPFDSSVKPIKDNQLKDKTSSIAPKVRSFGSLSGVRILLVDDESDNLELFRFILSMEGASVTACTSPIEALQFFAQSPHDLLLSDIRMPKMNGYELIRQIRSLPQQSAKQVPAIALTAFAQEEDRNKVLQAGYQGYLAKPVNPTHLIATLVKLLP